MRAARPHIDPMRSSALIVTASLVACMPTAHAQEFVPPRFEGLEQQQLNLEQRQYDRLEERLQSEQFRAAQPGAFPASSALRRMEIEREARELRREGAERRAATARETAIREAMLPNRRIAAHSSLVVTDPERYALPLAPAGQFYARLDGRFALVDADSEMVVSILEPSIGDPGNDLPARPLPDLQPGVALDPSVAITQPPR